MIRRYLLDTGIAQDIQIAAIARTLQNCTVVSKDADFTLIPGITVENWAS